MQPETICAVIPVKKLDRAKSRLGPLLTPSQRQAVSRAMLADVVAAARATSRIGRIVLVSADREVERIASDMGVECLAQKSETGYSQAVAASVRHLKKRGDTTLLMLPADLPIITAADIKQLLMHHGPAPAVTLSRARRDGGTNAIVSSPPDVISFAFGQNSIDRHIANARAAGVEPCVVDIPGFALDIDRPGDLRHLMEMPPVTNTQALLADLDIAGQPDRQPKMAKKFAPGERRPRRITA